MPLKPAIDIHNWVDIIYLHLHTYFHNPPKKRVWIVDPWHVQQVEPQTLIMEKNIGKTGQSALATWFHRKNQLWKKMAASKNYGKKKVRITSGIFWTLMGENPIMEKSDAGAACLSWTFFFHNSVGYHICLPIYLSVCLTIYLSIYLSPYLSIYLPIYLAV